MSSAVPNAYQCTTESGGNLNPCFVLSDGNLLCNPNPVFGSYSAVVVPGNTLPAIEISPEQSVAFYLQPGGNSAPCGIRTGDAYEIEGYAVSYNCDAPGAWLTGPVETTQPTWMVDLIITNSAGDTITTGPTISPVTQAWLY